MNELKNVNIKFVSIVDAAANKKKFAIVKNEDGSETFENYCPIIKADDEKQEVTAVVYEPDIKDAHGDYMTADEIEKAQRTHMIQGAKSDVQHSFAEDEGLHTVESWITKEDTKIGEQQVKKGTWMETMYIENDKIWKSVKDGKLTGFSMGGTGERIVENPISATGEKAETKKSLLRKFAEFIGIEKGTFKDNLDKKSTNEEYYTLSSALSDSINLYREGKAPQGKELKTILNDFSNSVYKLLNKEEEEMTMEIKKEDLQEMITETVQKAMNPAPSTEELIEKALEEAGVVKKEGEEGAEEVTEDEKIQKAVEGVLKSLGLEQKEETFEEKVAKAVAKAVEPMKENIEKMALAKGYTKADEQLPNSGESNIEKSYLDMTKSY